MPSALPACWVRCTTHSRRRGRSKWHWSVPPHPLAPRQTTLPLGWEVRRRTLLVPWTLVRRLCRPMVHMPSMLTMVHMPSMLKTVHMPSMLKTVLLAYVGRRLAGCCRLLWWTCWRR